MGGRSNEKKAGSRKSKRQKRGTSTVEGGEESGAMAFFVKGEKKREQNEGRERRVLTKKKGGAESGVSPDQEGGPQKLEDLGKQRSSPSRKSGRNHTGVLKEIKPKVFTDVTLKKGIGKGNRFNYTVT